MKTKSKLNPKEAGKKEIIVIIMEINMIENRKYNRKKKKPKAKSSRKGNKINKFSSETDQEKNKEDTINHLTSGVRKVT